MAVGVESDSLVVEQCTKKVREIGLAGRVEFLCRDMFSVDLGEFDAITIFQSQAAVERLAEKLRAEVHGRARIVSYLSPLGGFSPLRLLKPAKLVYPFYLYAAPLQYLDEFDSADLLQKLAKFRSASEIEWARVWTA
jgi:hypothetical protein